jgi:hypothetical protein
MENGTQICSMNELYNAEGNLYDLNFQRYVGWQVTESEFDRKFFSKETVAYINSKLFSLLKCLRKDGRPIVVNSDVIINVMSTAYETYRPQLGNGYFMYTQPQETPRNDFETLTDIVIEIVYNNIKTEYEMQEENKKLTIWNSVLGDFNQHGLRQHSILKINDNNINKVRFNMNY